MSLPDTITTVDATIAITLGPAVRACAARRIRATHTIQKVHPSHRAKSGKVVRAAVAAPIVAAGGLLLLSGTAFAQARTQASSAPSSRGAVGGSSIFLSAPLTDVETDSLRGLDTLLGQLASFSDIGSVGPTRLVATVGPVSPCFATAAASGSAARGDGGSRPLAFNRGFPITGNGAPPPTLSGNYTDSNNSGSARTESSNTDLHGFSLTYNGSDALTVNGVLSGTGAGSKVICATTNTLQFTGANTYAGGTTISSGFVGVGVSGGTATTASLGAGNVTVSAGTLSYYATSSAGASAATTIAINGGSGVSFYNTSTAGSATINNAIGLSFLDRSTAGSSIINNSSSLNFYLTSTAGGSAITNNSGGSLYFRNSSDAGSSVTTNNASGNIYFYDTPAADNATIVNNATTGRLDISHQTAGAGLSIGSLSGSGAVYLGSFPLTIGGLNTSTTISGVVQDGGTGGGTGGSLIKAGTGTLTLTAANTYTGGTTFNAGIVKVSADSGLGTTPTSAAANLTFGGGTLQFGGAFTLNANRYATLGSSGGTFDTNGNADTYGGIVSGSGGLTKAGTGTLTLTGANTYTGGTSFNGGVVNVSSDAGLGAVPGSAATNLTFNGGTLQFGGGFTLNANRNTTLGSGGTFDTQANSDTYGGILSGNGGLTKVGTGTLTLTGANTYTGGTTLSAGTLSVGVANGTATTASLGTGNVTITGGTLNVFAATSVGSSAVTLFTVSGGYLDFHDTATAGSATITTAAAGGLDFYNASTAGVSTINNNGTLDFVSTITSAASNATIVNNSTTGGVDLSRMSIAGMSIGSLSGSGKVYLGSKALTVGGLNTSTTISGIIQDGGNAGGTGGSLIKTGAGTLTLTGANTFTGGATISAGTVNVGVSGGTAATAKLGAGSVVMNSGTTLNYYAASSAGASAAATLNNNNGGSIYFYDTSTAGSSTINNGSGANLYFIGTPTAASATIVDNGILDLSRLTAGASLSIGSLSGSGAVYLGSFALTVSGLNTSTTFSGVIQDGGANGGAGGSLTKTGTGTLTLTGANTYTGNTTVSAGTLTLGNALALQDSTLVYNTGGTLSFGTLTGATVAGLSGSKTLSLTNTSAAAVALTVGNNDTTSQFSGVVSGSGSLVKTGVGTLTLTGASTYTGGTAFNAGIVNVAADSGLGAAPTSAATNLTFNGGTLQFGGAFTLNANRNATLGAGGGTFDTQGNAVTYGGVISGSGGLNVAATGAGDLTLTGANTYTGGTTVSSGVLSVGVSGGTATTAKLGTGSVTLVSGSNPELDFDAASSAGASAATVLTNNSGCHLFFFDTSTAGSATINNNDGGDLQFNGSSSAGSSTINTVYGVSFNNASTAGNSTINMTNGLYFNSTSTAGTSVINNNGGVLYFFDTSTAGSSTINNNGTLFFFDSSTGNNATVVNNGTVDLSHLAGGSALNIGSLSGAGMVDLGSFALTLGGLNTNIAVGGAIQDGGDAGGAGGSLTKVGTGTLTLTAANTYTGATTISAGTLQLGDGSTSNGSVSGNITDNAALIIANPNAQSYSGSISGSGSLTKAGTGTLTLTGANTYTGATTVNAGTLALANTSGTINSSNLTINNGGTVLVAAGNALSGFPANTSQTVTINAGGTLTTASNTALSLYNVTLNGGTLASSPTQVAANGSYNLRSGYAINATANSAITATGQVLFSGSSLSAASGVTLTDSGTITDNSGFVGQVTKTGAGTLTLTGANTYTGGTTVSVGTIAARGTALGTGAVTVASGATLSVGETLNTTRTSLTTSSLSAKSLAVTLGNATPLLTFNLGAPGTNDVLNLTGTGNELTFSGAGAFDIGFASSTGASLGAGAYTLITLATPEAATSAPLLSSYTAVPKGNLGKINGGAFSYITSGANVIGLKFTIGGSADALPEPSSLALLLLAPGALAMGRTIAQRRGYRFVTERKAD